MTNGMVGIIAIGVIAYLIGRDSSNADTPDFPNVPIEPVLVDEPYPWVPAPEPIETWPTDQWPWICPVCGHIRDEYRPVPYVHISREEGAGPCVEPDYYRTFEVVGPVIPPFIPSCPVCGYRPADSWGPEKRGFDPLIDVVKNTTDAAKVTANALGYDYSVIYVSDFCTNTFPQHCETEYTARRRGNLVGGTNLSMSIDESNGVFEVHAREYTVGTVRPYLADEGYYLVTKGKVNWITETEVAPDENSM